MAQMRFCLGHSVPHKHHKIPAVLLNIIIVRTMVEILIFLIYTEQRKLLSVWFFKFFFPAASLKSPDLLVLQLDFVLLGKLWELLW